MDFFAYYDSPLGPITLTFDVEALTPLPFGEHPTSHCPLPTIYYPLSTSFRWLDRYFSGHEPDFLPPLKPTGTAFQQRVLTALMEIPYGQTTTYGALARRVGCRSAHAIGQAVGRNPIAVIIPCHRVIGSNGSLTGYAYGLERKEYLLGLEAARP